MNKICKKLVVMVLAVCMVMGVLAGCGNGSEGSKEKTPDIVGTWKASTVEAAGVTVDFNKYAEQLGQDAESIKTDMEIKEDKTFSMDMMGQTTEGTWEEKNGKYILTVDGLDQEVSITDGKLVFEEKTANIKLTFEKK